jgi:hypothetical protein
MRVAALRVEFLIADARSLKEKRAVVRPIIEGLRRRLSVSVAEVDHQDSWQRCVLGVAVVASDGGRLDALVEAIRRYLDGVIEIEVCDLTVSYLEEEP